MSTSDAGEAGILGTEEANMEFVEADDGEEVMVDDRINLMAAAPEKQPFLSGDLSATTLFMNKGGLTNYLKENAPKGEFLAYINPDEATMLKRAGGSGKLVNGIPSFEPRSSREADQKSGKTGSGDKDRPNPHTVSGTSKTSTKSETKTSDEPTAKDLARGNQWKGAPKTREKTITGTITKGPFAGNKYSYKTPVSYQDYNKKDLFSSRTGFGPKGKDTWHEAAVKNVKDYTKTGPTAGEIFGWGLTLVSAGVIPAPAAIKTIATGYGTVKNVKTAINVVEKFTSKTPKDKKEPTTVKGAITTAAKNVAKEKIAKELGISVKQVDEITKIGINAWNSDIGQSVKNKFTETFTTSPKEKTTDPNERFSDKPKITFTGGDNDGPQEVIIPVVPEFLEEKVIVEEPTSSLSDAATLDLIRNRQNTRRSFFNANSGGLAGLFKVKKQ